MKLKNLLSYAFLIVLAFTLTPLNAAPRFDCPPGINTIPGMKSFWDTKFLAKSPKTAVDLYNIAYDLYRADPKNDYYLEHILPSFYTNYGQFFGEWPLQPDYFKRGNIPFLTKLLEARTQFEFDEAYYDRKDQGVSNEEIFNRFVILAQQLRAKRGLTPMKMPPPLRVSQKPIKEVLGIAWRSGHNVALAALKERGATAKVVTDEYDPLDTTIMGSGGSFAGHDVNGWTLIYYDNQLHSVGIAYQRRGLEVQRNLYADLQKGLIETYGKPAETAKGYSGPSRNRWILPNDGEIILQAKSNNIIAVMYINGQAHDALKKSKTEKTRQKNTDL